MKQEDFIIIWEWNLWTYVKSQLDENNYSSEIFAAKKFHLEENYKNQINEILLVQTLENLINWKKILFTWRQGELFNKILEKIENLNKKYKQNFFVFWVNWIEKYWDLPQLTLNAKITQNEVIPFDKSYLYHSESGNIDLEFVEKLNLDIEVISNKNEYLEYFFSKALLNLILNSASVLYFQNTLKSYYSLLNMYNLAFIEEDKQFLNHIKEWLEIWKTELEKEDWMNIFDIIETILESIKERLEIIWVDEKNISNISNSFMFMMWKFHWKWITDETIELIINNLENNLLKYRWDIVKKQFIKEFNIYLKKNNVWIQIEENEFFKYLNNTLSKIWNEYPSSFYQHWWINPKNNKKVTFNRNKNKPNSDMESILKNIVDSDTPLFTDILNHIKHTKDLDYHIILSMFNNFVTDIKKQREKVEEFYDDTLDEYDDTFSEPAEYISDFIKFLPEKAEILDLGCWNWINSKYFFDKWFNVTATDISWSFIEKNKQRFPWINFLKSDMIKDDFWVNSFNWVFSSFSLIHIEKKEIIQILNKIKKSLKDNWILYLSLQEKNLWKDTITSSPLNPTEELFIDSFSYYEIVDLLEQNWFLILEKYKRWPKKHELDFNKLFIIAKKVIK